MGYLFLAIALLAGRIKGFCGKKISGRVSSLKGTFYINAMRMLMCVLISFFVVAFQGINGFKIDTYTFMITLFSGVSTAWFVVMWLICVRKGAFVMLDIFVLLGVGVTVGLCKVFFNEEITIYQCIAFVLLILASFIMCSYSSNIKGEFTLKSLLLLLACGLLSGLADFAQKWFVYAIPNGSIAVFNFYTFAFSTLVLFIFFAVSDKLENEENDGKSLSIFLNICIMAACLFVYSFFRTIAAKYITSAILYPISSGVAIVLSAIMASVFFGEKITKKCIIGVIITLIALIVMNL